MHGEWLQPRMRATSWRMTQPRHARPNWIHESSEDYRWVRSYINAYGFLLIQTLPFFVCIGLRAYKAPNGTHQDSPLISFPQGPRVLSQTVLSCPSLQKAVFYHAFWHTLHFILHHFYLCMFIRGHWTNSNSKQMAGAYRPPPHLPHLICSQEPSIQVSLADRQVVAKGALDMLVQSLNPSTGQISSMCLCVLPRSQSPARPT
jgi:hypothetical protein